MKAFLHSFKKEHQYLKVIKLNLQENYEAVYSTIEYCQDDWKEY
jgi:hypothetical protein